MNRLVPIFFFAGLAGCTTVQTPAEPHLSQISRGPCFGFCPVYDLKFGDGGTVEFTGLRHTAFIGTKTVRAPALREALDRELEFARPQVGSGEFPCTEQVTDQAFYQVQWMQADGSVATLRFNSGCRSPEGTRLKQLLDSAVERAGLGADAAQVTRPGTSRG